MNADSRHPRSCHTIEQNAGISIVDEPVLQAWRRHGPSPSQRSIDRHHWCDRNWQVKGIVVLPRLTSQAYRRRQLAVELAKRFNGEVINGDVMQMYKGLSIITNKIPETERNSIPHHLLGTVSLASEPWTVPQFVHESQRIIQEIRSRGRLPILVGGSHYYTQALLLKDSLVAKIPDTPQISDDEGGASTQQTWPILSAATPEIYAKLSEVDPVIAKRWHPNDRRRVQRSLEIWLQTGRKASEIYEEQHQQRISQLQVAKLQEDTTDGSSGDTAAGAGMRYPTLVLWVETAHELLRRRLDCRVEAMVKDGMIEEALYLDRFVRDQEAKGCPVDTGRGIWISIGYKELKPYINATRSGNLDKGSLDSLKELCVEDTKIATRQYARRQKRWIRIRLANSLEEAGATKQFFVLDSTHLEKWDSNVKALSQCIVEGFLKGGTLPDPPSLSELAAKVLPKLSLKESRHQTFMARTCEVCHKTMTTDLAWECHLASRRHSKALYSKSKREQAAARPQEVRRSTGIGDLVDT
jgi:tRNA dimethylallyltransferase